MSTVYADSINATLARISGLSRFDIYMDNLLITTKYTE